MNIKGPAAPRLRSISAAVAGCARRRRGRPPKVLGRSSLPGNHFPLELEWPRRRFCFISDSFLLLSLIFPIDTEFAPLLLLLLLQLSISPSVLITTFTVPLGWRDRKLAPASNALPNALSYTFHIWIFPFGYGIGRGRALPASALQQKGLLHRYCCIKAHCVGPLADAGTLS